MKETSGYISEEKAHSLIEAHQGIMEQRIIKHGNQHNNYMDTHKCILWGDYYEETDPYGNKSLNRHVKDEFYWQEKVPDFILKCRKNPSPLPLYYY